MIARDVHEALFAARKTIAAVALLVRGRPVAARGRFAEASIAVSGIRCRYEAKRKAPRARRRYG